MQPTIINGAVRPEVCDGLLSLALTLPWRGSRVIDVDTLRDTGERNMVACYDQASADMFDTSKSPEFGSPWAIVAEDITERLLVPIHGAIRCINHHVLRYGPGAKTCVHADNEAIVAIENDEPAWKRFWPFTKTAVLYLNSDFEGGEVFFPQFELEVKPLAGTVVTFAADRTALHGVQPVKNGIRYAMVMRFKEC